MEELVGILSELFETMPAAKKISLALVLVLLRRRPGLDPHTANPIGHGRLLRIAGTLSRSDFCVRFLLDELLRVRFKYRQTMLAAEIIDLTVVLIARCRRVRLNLHATGWIDHSSLPGRNH